MKSFNQRFITGLLVSAVALMSSGCETAYYELNEQFGRLKNDILVDRVEEAVDAQEEAKEEFKSAFEQFEAVVGVPESDLKSVYNKLASALEDAQDKAAAVESRVAAVEDVSEDLFEEWEEEIDYQIEIEETSIFSLPSIYEVDGFLWDMCIVNQKEL